MSGGVVCPAAEVFHSVADDEVVDVEQQVVCRDLGEDVGRDGDVGSLVFHNHPRPHLSAVEHGVGAQMLAADGELHLVGKQRGRVAKVVDEVVDEVLAHPFLWREGNVAAAKRVENLHPLTRARQSYFEGW